MPILLDLFLTFAKVGVMTFGGGYAMLPILQREVVENKGWATEEELMDYFAIGQCTPGIIAVNTATFIGQKYKGTLGAIFTTLGVVFPSVVIISVLASVIEAFSHLVWVQNAFGGIRICVCVLIANAVVKLYKKAVVDKLTLVIFLAVALGMLYMAFVAIATYTHPSYELGYAIKFFRIISLILTSLFQVWGYIAGIVLLLTCIVTNKMVSGQSYLYPLIPFDFKKLSDAIFRKRLPDSKE